jgi:hypothetical protein
MKVCPRCGSQNPDGNAFCQSCGTPLAATVAATPYAAPSGPPVRPPAPLAYASPPPLPAGYQSPYYTPAAGAMQPPVHRTPWALIVSAVVALILVMAGAGTAIAVIGAHNNGSSGNVSLGNGLPTPSPAGSPSPVGSPTAHVVSGPNATNDGVSIPLPAGWTVNTKDSESITLVTPSGDGSLTAASGPSFPTATAQQNKSDIDKYFQSKYPDTRNCPGSSTTNGTLNGAPGIFWTLCFTLTSGSQSVPAAASLFAGANSAGSVYYIVMLVTAQTNLPALVSQSKPLLQGLQWKLR